MRTMNLAIVLLAWCCCFVSAQPRGDREQIAASISEISKAYVSRDPVPFQRLYVDTYASIREKPIYNLRDQLIAMMQADSVLIRAGKRPEYETVRYENEPPQITLHGRVAIANVARRNYWQYRGQKCQTRTQATEVWVKLESDWKLAAGHATTFQCDPKPFHPIHAAVAEMQSRTKAPPNTDHEAEQQVRELIRTLVSARASLDEPFDAVVGRYMAEGFVSTDLNATVGRDRSPLSTIQVPLPNRSAGFRNQEDAVLIYGDAAVYTYRIRTAESSSDYPRQCTIVFTRTRGKWLIAAAHTSKPADD